MADPNLDTIFCAAIELPSAEERAAYIAQACGDDVELHSRVERLLAAHFRAGSFLESVAGPVGTSQSAEGSHPALPTALCPLPTVPEGPGTVIGGYKLLEQIGEGGFGVVFMAEQTQPVRRKVALKILKPGMDTRQVVARFEAERQALAIMDHPNIAKVLDGGSTEPIADFRLQNADCKSEISNLKSAISGGRPYFVMELVKGVPITEFCDQNHLTPRQRLELFIPVCQAVQHAHQKGIIHRDLKPSNVLVTVHDTTPVPKVIDFGVAKALGQELTDKTLFTGFAQMIGTPLYMSPEQAGQSGLDIDTRSDIYSLGVLLYELLTGTTPFDKERFKQAAYDEIRRIIREEEPPKPSTRLSESKDTLPSISAQRQTEPAKLTKLVRGELDWIVMKALEKDRNRRYETANGFVQDIQRYLADEPVQACPPSVGYRLRKFVRRNKGPVLAASLVLLALVVGVIGTTLGLFRAEQQRMQAQANLRKACDAVDRMLTRVGKEHLEHIPQMEKARAQILQDALEFYQGFLQEYSTDRSVQAETAKAYTRVGEIQYGLGQPEKAEVAYRQALSLLHQLTAEAPNDPADQQALAGTYESLGVALRHLRRLHEAESANQQALNLYEKLAADFPSEHKYRQHLVTIHSNLGLVLWDAKKLPEAEQAFRRVAELHDQLAPEFRKQPKSRLVLALSQANMGNVLRRTNRRQQADATYGQALKLLEELATEFRDEPLYKRHLANTYKALGNYLQPSEAEKSIHQALKLYEQLATDFPHTPKYRADLADCYFRLGSLLYQGLNRISEAEQPLRQAVKVLEKLAADFPKVPAYKEKLASTWHVLGGVLGRSSQFQEAEAAWRRTVKLWQELADDFLEEQRYRGEVRRNVYNLGVSLSGGGKYQEAEQVYRQELKTRLEEVKARLEGAAKKPDFSDPWFGLDSISAPAECASALGNLLVTVRRFSQAEEVFRDAIDFGNELAAKFPDNASLHFQLGRTHGSLAGLLRQQGKPNQACQPLEQAIKHQKTASRLKYRFPSNNNALLCSHYLRLADTLVQLGTEKYADRVRELLREAYLCTANNSAAQNNLAWFLATCPDRQFHDPHRAVELGKKLVEKEAKNGAYWNTLGTAHYRAGDWKASIAALEKSMQLRKGGDSFDFFFLAMAHWQLGDKEEARKWYDQAVQWMDKHKPQNEELGRFRAEVEQLLGIQAQKK